VSRFTGGIMPSSTMYWEYSLRGDQFQPIVEGEQGGITFFHTSARWRQIHGVDGDDYIPFYARYFGGGPSPRHRGFEQDHLSPTEINRNGEIALVGGTTDALLSEELSFPVQDSNEGIRLAVFCDYGNVWGADQEIRLPTCAPRSASACASPSSCRSRSISPGCSTPGMANRARRSNSPSARSISRRGGARPAGRPRKAGSA
jgi:outer membrane protein assembly factor BamA